MGLMGKASITIMLGLFCISFVSACILLFLIWMLLLGDRDITLTVLVLTGLFSGMLWEMLR